MEELSVVRGPWLEMGGNGARSESHRQLTHGPRTALKRPDDPMSRFFSPSPFLSVTHRENAITSLFSSTHWEHFFCPFVFNKPLGAIFIFNIFLGQRPVPDLDQDVGEPPQLAQAGVFHPLHEHGIFLLGSHQRGDILRRPDCSSSFMSMSWVFAVAGTSPGPARHRASPVPHPFPALGCRRGGVVLAVLVGRHRRLPRRFPVGAIQEERAFLISSGGLAPKASLRPRFPGARGWIRVVDQPAQGTQGLVSFMNAQRLGAAMSCSLSIPLCTRFTAKPSCIRSARCIRQKVRPMRPHHLGLPWPRPDYSPAISSCAGTPPGLPPGRSKPRPAPANRIHGANWPWRREPCLRGVTAPRDLRPFADSRPSSSRSFSVLVLRT